MKTKKILIIISITILLSIVIYYFYQTHNIKTATQDFLTSIKGQNAEKLKDQLGKQTNNNILNALKFLTDQENGQLIGPKKTRLTGLSTGETTITLTQKGKEYPLRLALTKNNGNWKLTQIKNLQVYPKALLLDAKKESQTTVINFINNGKLESLTNLTEENLSKDQAYYLVGYQGKLIYQKPYEKKLISKVLLVKNDYIETENGSLLSLEAYPHYYSLGNERPKLNKLKDLIVGQENITVYSDQGKVALITASDKINITNIRVALNTADFKGLHHNLIELSSPAGLYLENKLSNQKLNFEAGETLTLRANKNKISLASSMGKTALFSGRVIIKPLKDSVIKISNLKRGSQGETFMPSYPGQLEIINQKGTLTVINELPLEKYLHTVVASEMPITFGLDALKVQAIAARSYALANIYQSQYSDKGAHVEDSIFSQVFNNTKEHPIANKAVEATKGWALFFQNGPIDAKFFSTSSGFTANYHEVWQNPETGIFPGKPIPYLKSKSQLPGKNNLQLLTEEQLRIFLTSPNNLAFDRPSPFFRWQIEMTGPQLAASIEKNLSARYQADPKFILTRSKGGWKSIPINKNPLGSLKDLKIISRGEGGNVTELQIEGSQGTYLIKKEFNIRSLLSPQNYLDKNDILLQRWDGSVLKNYPILPSTFFVMDIFSDMEPREISKIIFYGGGNGHGVGMSQWGVKGMLEQRYTLKEIFQHYYPETRLVNIFAES